MKMIHPIMTTLLLGAMALVAACTGVQVDSASADKFKEGNYRSYSWLGAPVENTGGSHDPLYVIDPALRAAVDKELASKGYRQVASGGDFNIDYQFKASLADGELSSTARESDNVYPYADAPAMVNRRTDQALVDNAYALSGPREMNSILLRFSDGQDQGLVWAGAMSKLVENLNHENSKKMVQGINTAVRRVLQSIPTAP